MASTDRIQGYSGDLAIKTPCRAATTANTALAGLLTIDGVTLVDGDRVLVKNQATAAENGIYIASAATWNRAPDFDGPNDVVKGTDILVTDGATHTGAFFTVAAENPVLPGTSAITFTDAASSAANAAAAAASASTASGYVTAAGAQAAAAAGSAVQAAGSLAPVTATSTTSLAIGTGAKSLVIEAGKLWAPGHPIKIAQTSNPTVNYMTGTVTAYNSGTGGLSVSVAAVGGSGTIAAWTLTLQASAGTIGWASVTSTPTTLSGYGISDAAPAADPEFTGTPIAPTAAQGTATTQLATTAFADRLRDVQQSTKTAQHTLALVDRGTSIDITTGGILIPTNASVAFPVGSTISAYNNSATAQDISAVTSGTTTVRKAGTATTGTLSLRPYGVATMRKVATDVWVVSGTLA